jgi:hypothetical protein
MKWVSDYQRGAHSLARQLRAGTLRRFPLEGKDLVLAGGQPLAGAAACVDSDLVPGDSRKNLQGKAPSLLQRCRFAVTVVVANEHSGRRVVGSARQVRIEVLLLATPVRHQHRRLSRQMHPVLDPKTALVLAQPVIRVSVAVLTPRLAGDRLEGWRGQGTTQDSRPLR